MEFLTIEQFQMYLDIAYVIILFLSFFFASIFLSFYLVNTNQSILYFFCQVSFFRKKKRSVPVLNAFYDYYCILSVFLFQPLHIPDQFLPVIYGLRPGQDIMRFHTLIHIVEGTVLYAADLSVPRDREQGSRGCRARQDYTRTAGCMLPQQDGPVGVLQHSRHQVAA